MKRIKVLNLYAGIGGNRKLWENVDVIAIENVPEIAKIYQDFFPSDKVIICDAHQYLSENFDKFDFIWSSPPCPSHSIIRKNTSVERGQSKPIFPDMKLYEEILFLRGYFQGKWVVENVKSYYKPLMQPQEVQRHYFWANFHIPPLKLDKDNISKGKIREWEVRFGFNLDKYRLSMDKKTLLRNCVHPKLGQHILKIARSHSKTRLDQWT